MILAAVFLGECLVVVRIDGVAFAPWWPGRYKRARPFALRGSRTVGVTLSPPWPPLDTALPTETLRLQVRPDGLDVDGEPVLWEAVPRVSAAGREVHVGARVIATSASERAAAELAAWLDALRQRQGRAATLSAGLDRRFDVMGAAERWSAARRAVLGMRLGGLALYLGLFILMPVAMFTDLPVPGVAVATLVGMAWAAVVLACFRRRKELRLEGGQLAMITLSPLAAIRAADLVLREVFLGLEPVAAALVLKSPETRELAREAMADWTLRRSTTWLDAELARRAQPLLEELGDLFEAPEVDPGAVAYCPRCAAQFVETTGDDCVSCGDVPLRRFSRP